MIRVDASGFGAGSGYVAAYRLASGTTGRLRVRRSLVAWPHSALRRVSGRRVGLAGRLQYRRRRVRCSFARDAPPPPTTRTRRVAPPVLACAPLAGKSGRAELRDLRAQLWKRAKSRPFGARVAAKQSLCRPEASRHAHCLHTHTQRGADSEQRATQRDAAPATLRQFE